MRLILGTIIFWIMILGINKFLENKFHINKNFTLVLTFSLIGIIVFIAGILNIMKIVSLLLIISSVIYFVYSLCKEKPKLSKIKEEILKTHVIIPTTIFIYITMIGMDMHLTHYDNFSHWGLIIKNMLLDNALPNFEDSMIMFKGYQPGSACFVYIYGLLAGKTETAMIIGHNYLTFAFLTPLFAFIKGNNKKLKNALIAIFYIFIMTISIKFNDLLVDSMIATMAISSLAIINYYKKDLKKATLYSLPITVFTFLVKNTGFLIGIINCIYLLYLSHKNKNIKEGWKYTFITMITLVITLLIWQGHVKLAFGEMALYSKHSLSSDNIILSLRTKGWDKLFLFIKEYALHLFTLKNNITNIYILIINVILLLFAITNNKKYKKETFIITGIIDLLYLFYYLIIGGMYLFSMPWEEAIVFAGYERYMTTIIIIIIGIVLMYMLSYDKKQNNLKYFLTITIIFMILSMNIFPGNVLTLLGQDGYQGSLANKYDLILKKYKPSKEEFYYIYSPSSKNDFSYLEFMSKYKLNTGNIEMIYSEEDLDLTKSGTIIFIDEDKDLIEQASKSGWKRKTEVILEKR